MSAFSDRELLKQQQAGALGTSGAATPLTEIKYVHSNAFVFDKASDDAMASTTTSETYTGIYFPRACKLIGVYYVPTTGSITADNTNYATVTVNKRVSGASTAIATLTTTITSSGDITQGAGTAFVNSTVAGAISIAAGGSITFSIAKAGSGVVVRGGRFSVVVEWV
jgi:hypothetical protein